MSRRQPRRPQRTSCFVACAHRSPSFPACPSSASWTRSSKPSRPCRLPLAVPESRQGVRPMHSNHAAFLHFRDVLRSVAPLPEGNQILVLENELLHALGRASESERRSRVLERELERLRTYGRHAGHADLEQQLAEARRELARSKADGQEQ